ncbi:MAG: hypothetical protein JSV19_05215 [Phycisphaerales bacterium]|nr:MAG: hypothetical protein JSV19_05215 [Phycisphaerales bacterium]
MSRLVLIPLTAGWLVTSLAGCATDALFADDKAKMGPVTLAGPVVDGKPTALAPTHHEKELVENVALDRGRYRNALLALRACYHHKGNHIKVRWTEQEINGLRRIEPFDDAGPETATALGQETDLVEELMLARRAYHLSLAALHALYCERGDPTTQQWVKQELADARRIQPFSYLDDAGIPGGWLRPEESIPEADALFERAYARMREGGHGVPVFYREEIMLDALDMMRQVIYQHPTSDKIDDAAFYIGEIHKEYLKDQSEIAVQWYERAWTWDPHTPHAARFQAAVVYDYRMHDRARALELYHAVLEHETFNRSNVPFAKERIRQLTEELEAGRRSPSS